MAKIFNSKLFRVQAVASGELKENSRQSSGAPSVPVGRQEVAEWDYLKASPQNPT